MIKQELRPLLRIVHSDSTGNNWCLAFKKSTAHKVQTAS